MLNDQAVARCDPQRTICGAQQGIDVRARIGKGRPARVGASAQKEGTIRSDPQVAVGGHTDGRCVDQLLRWWRDPGPLIINAQANFPRIINSDGISVGRDIECLDAVGCTVGEVDRKLRGRPSPQPVVVFVSRHRQIASGAITADIDGGLIEQAAPAVVGLLVNAQAGCDTHAAVTELMQARGCG